MIHFKKELGNSITRMHTLSFENIRTPFATSINASFWGVVTITAAVKETTCICQLNPLNVDGFICHSKEKAINKNKLTEDQDNENTRVLVI